MENKRTETNKTVQKRLEPELKLINMDTVEVEQIEWLLYPFIPYGKVTIIQGDPGYYADGGNRSEYDRSRISDGWDLYSGYRTCAVKKTSKVQVFR